jgi:hypothetical protein
MSAKLRLGIATFLSVLALPVWGLAAKTKSAKVLIPAGTILHVRLQTTLTSKTNKTGDKFTAVLEQPVNSEGEEVVPRGSIVKGHVVFVEPSKRIKGTGQMRIVLDEITTPDDENIAMSGTLEDANGGPCVQTGTDDEGTVKSCGKSKKDALKDSAIGGAMGAGVGATIGLGSEIDCSYYGNCGGPGMGQATLYGAGLGAATALIYNLFKHEKQVVLVGGMHLTFVVNRSVMSNAVSEPPQTSSNEK